MPNPTMKIPLAGDNGKVATYDHATTGVVWSTASGGTSSDNAHIYVTGLVEGNTAAAQANTNLIQAALDAAWAATLTRGALTGGGAPRGAKVVQLPPGEFYITRSAHTDAWYSLSLPTSTILRGAGWGTRLILVSGTIPDSSQELACSGVWFASPSSFAGVEYLTLHGNSGGQAANTWSHGIDARRNDVSEMYDGGLFANQVMAWGWPGNGINFGWVGGMRGEASGNTANVTDCMAYHNVGNGFQLKTDQRVSGCKAGNNFGNGFQIHNGTSVLLTNCKGFGSGKSDLSISYCEQIIVDNFTSEDFKGASGINLAVVRHSRITGGVYRSMTTNPIGYNAGLWVEDTSTPEAQASTDPWFIEKSQNLDIQLVCAFPTSDGNVIYPQKHLITRNLGAAVHIRMGAKPGTWTQERWQDLGGSTDADIQFNNSNSGVVTVSYAASITPVPDNGEMHLVGALTGNVTINNPAWPYKGQRVGFRFLQDATGGRTVTWGSAFKTADWTVDTTASAYSALTFTYDGSNWVRTSGGGTSSGTVNAADTIVVSNNQTGTAYTLVLADAGRAVTMNNAAANTLTVPTNATVAFPVGTVITVEQHGAGQTTIAPAGGVTLQSRGAALKLAAQWASASLRKTATDVWIVAGDLVV